MLDVTPEWVAGILGREQDALFAFQAGEGRKKKR